MTLEELREIVAQGESDSVEFKRSTSLLREAMHTVCAMQNGAGGFVLIGVKDNGEITGQQVADSTLREVAQELRRFDPVALPGVETVDLGGGRSVVALRVPGGGGPYTYDGRAYMRVSSTTRLMPREEHERRLLERMHPTARWENQHAVDFRLEDLDHAEIVRTVEEGIRRQRMDDPGTRDPVELLRGLNLFNDQGLVNAAVVLFGKANRLPMNYPQCLLKLARFRGRDKSEFLDNRQEHGNAFELFQRAQRFMRDHLPVAGRILPNLFERVDDPLYPPAALREALANALCHRDYSIGGGSVSVAIYDDRLEIGSIGELHFGLTPAALRLPHQSRPWNPLIAGVFYRRGIIETWGRGTIKMAELMTQAGLVAPEIQGMAGETVVTFRPPTAPVTGQVTVQVGAGHKIQFGQELKVEHLVAGQVTGQVAVQVLRYCETPRKASEIQAFLKMKHRQTFRENYLDPLLEKGWLERTIPGKPQSRLQQYRLAAKGKEWLKS